MIKLEAHSRPSKFRFWTSAHRLVAMTFLVVLVLGHQTWFPWLKGSPTGTTLLGWLPLTDPLAALETAIACRQVTSAMLIGTGILMLTAVLLGRVFCGWLCPLGLVLELNDLLRTWLDRRLHRIRCRLPQFQFPKAFKYWLLLALLIASLVAALPVFTTFSPINLLVLSLVVTPGWELALLGGIVAVEYAAPRAFCRSLCPLGALYAILGRAGRWRVQIQPETGEQLFCQLCTKTCPMGIDVFGAHVLAGKPTVDDPECTRCGTCADGCLGQMLHLNFSGLQNPETAPRSDSDGCSRN